jgi:CubicO group peptidase (beta-lactamase class C family)
MQQTELQALLDRHINKGHIYNVVVGIQSQDRSLDVAGAAGIADPATGTQMTVDTPYNIASITKMYTAAVILKLHEQGLLDLDDVISTYLPGSLINGIHVYKGHDYSGQIRVYQLVNHTSGLADYYLDKPRGGQSVFDELKRGYDRALDIGQIMTIVRSLSPQFAPGARHGTKAHYADTNYQLLGAIMESVTGKSIADTFQQMIFAPLHLTHTYLYDAAASRAHPTPATIYYKEQVFNLPAFFASKRTDGGIFSTVGETLVFLRAFFDGKLFAPQFFDRMMRRWNAIFFPMQYGYGMMRIKLPRVFSPFRPLPELIGHSGSTGAFAYYCPKKALYLVGTVNQITAQRRAFQLRIQMVNALK